MSCGPFDHPLPNASISVEGHCDERGSAEYNLGLGDRRSTSAKEFLTRFEPGALNLLPDPEKTLGEDTIRAAALATQNGIQPAADGRYPLSVWERIYPL